ncbi:MAG: hypothetical protein MPN21_26535 [Thermoanaerobaculia bacterium]|nr:hypothetical protein [Thermoanaerobaculia bacterium]
MTDDSKLLEYDALKPGQRAGEEDAARRSYPVWALRVVYIVDSEQLIVFVLDIGERGKIYR